MRKLARSVLSFILVLILLSPIVKAAVGPEATYLVSFFYDLGFEVSSPLYLRETRPYISGQENLIVDRYSLALTSENNINYESLHETVILICNDEYILPKYFSCNRKSTQGEELFVLYKFRAEPFEEDFVLQGSTYLGKRIIVIPSDYLTINYFRSKITTYFHALHNTEVSRLGLDKSYLEDQPLYELLDSISESPMFVVLTYLSLLYFMVVLFFHLKNVSNLKERNFLITLDGLLLLFALLVLIQEILVLKSLNELFSLSSFVFLFFGSLNLDIIWAAYQSINNGQLLLSITEVIFLVFGAIFCISNTIFLVRDLKSSGGRLLKAFNPAFIVCLLVLSNFLLILFPFYKISELLLYIAFILLISVAQFSEDDLNKIQAKTPYVLVLFIVSLAVSFMFPADKFLYVTKFLLPKDSDLALLPLDIAVNKSIKFTEEPFDIDIPVFANEYMIYHPKYSKIIHRNIMDFTPKGNYILLSSDNRDLMSQVLLSTPSLLNNLVTDEFSGVILIENMLVREEDRVFLKLNYDCKTPISFHQVNFKPYYFLSDGTNTVRTNASRLNLLTFPGCDSGNSEYIIPVELGRFANGTNLLRFNEESVSEITRISVIVNDKVIPIKYLKNVRGREILLENYLEDTGNLYVYSPDIYEDLVIDSETGDLSFSSDTLVNNINTLIRAGNISTTLKLWSNRLGVVLRYADE